MRNSLCAYPDVGARVTSFKLGNVVYLFTYYYAVRFNPAYLRGLPQWQIDSGSKGQVLGGIGFSLR